ncbi:MAG: hypothetical protein CMN96_08400 [Synechococcus sp. MED850]|nr:hypothetical protein [Synechococcus sp. MED850]OUW97218.1 MAG: hypothetical protein CBD89_05900 [Cyanobacteria bacterium TMED229]
MEKDAAAQMLEDLQKRFPGLTPELAAQTLLAESLKACRSIADMTKLPVDPKVLDQLRSLKLLDQQEWERLIQMLDPGSRH